jgi:L-ascorbate metabolism protein UlaG (beta-lactamase superfamily)
MATISKELQSDNGVLVRYLGQVGFLLRRRGLTVVIDPHLSDSGAQANSVWIRNYPPPVEARELAQVDLVLCTHDHSDHTDPGSLLGILAASPACRFAGPRTSVAGMVRAGIPREQTTELNEGAGLKLPGLTIEPVAAAHEDYEMDAEGYHRYLSYFLHWEGLSLFHAGDTVITPEFEKQVGRHAIDIGFLPINGRDDDRRRLDIIGNMDSAEAVHFSTRLARGKGFRLLVPTHYDLYSVNGADIREFIRLWEEIAEPKPGIKTFSPGEELLYLK